MDANKEGSIIDLVLNANGEYEPFELGNKYVMEEWIQKIISRVAMKTAWPQAYFFNQGKYIIEFSYSTEMNCFKVVKSRIR